MCGIAGFTHREWLPAPSLIAESARCIHHRGPGSIGHVRVAHRLAGRGAAEDHRSRRRRSADAQRATATPSSSSTARSTTTPSSARELESLGVRFQSRCDTEVVLRAYVQWGTDRFARLRGMFAFAIWTESERRLVLVRDRLGIKPLYFHRRGDDLYFGSELKTLFAHPEIDRRIDPDGPESTIFR